MSFEYKGNPREEASIGGLRASIAAFFICISFFLGMSFIVSLASLILEKENEFVRFYAERTLAVNIIFLVLLVCNIVIFIGQIVFLLGFAALSVYQIIACYKAYKGDTFDLPFMEKICDFLFA